MSGRNVRFVKYITTNPGFLRNLYKLGVSAREKREAGFHVHLFPNKEIRSSEVFFGGIAHLPQKNGLCSTARERLPLLSGLKEKNEVEQGERDFEHITKVLDIHCHSILKLASWKDFFSNLDLDPMLSGLAIGLVTAPLNPPGMGLLVAHPKSSLHNKSQERIRKLQQSALTGFLLWLSVFREQGIRISPSIWMEGAVVALKSAGLAAGTIIYRFPHECSEEQFLSENTAARHLTGAGWKDRHRKTTGAFNFGQNMLNDRLLWRIREENDALEISPAKLRKGLGEACKSYYVSNDKKAEISLEEYFNAPEEKYQRITKLLSEKIQLALWEGIELSRQLIKKLGITGYLELKAEDLVDWKIEREDAAKIEKTFLLGIAELEVLTEVSGGRIERSIKQGSITPDFTVSSGENTSYFFLEIPPALAKREK